MAEPRGTDRDPEAVSRFVEHFAAQLVEAGLPRMPARVFAALLASDTGVMTSAELGEQLRVSPAGMVRSANEAAPAKSGGGSVTDRVGLPL